MYASTITEVYRPLAAYLRQQTAASGSVTAEVTLSPLDTFLLQQAAAFLPEPPTVIDLAARQTAWATAILWASSDQVVGRVQIMGDKTAAEAVRTAASALGLTADKLDFQDEPGATPTPDVAINTTLLVVATPAQAAAALRYLDHAGPACLAVPGVGKTGADPGVETLLALAGSHSAYRLTLMRELAPALAESELAIISRHSWPDGAALLERVALSFRGNFDFLRLARENVQLHEHIAGLRSIIADQKREIDELRQGKGRRNQSAPPIDRVRGAYHSAVPLSLRRRVSQALRGTK